MAYTTTDLANIQNAIMALAMGTRSVSVSIAGKSITYAETNLPALKILRSEIQGELGSVPLRTYAKQGGRGA